MRIFRRPPFNRALALGIALAGAAGLSLGWTPPLRLSTLERGAFPLMAPLFLEEWLGAGQAGLFSGLRFLGVADTPDSLALSQLIAERADPLSWRPSEISMLSRIVLEKSREYGISPLLVLALIDVESGFEREAVSSRGAVGLLQLKPDTAEMVASRGGISWNPGSLLEPEVNIDLGLRYITELRRQFSGNDLLALAAYNIGPRALRERLAAGEPLTHRYAERVLRRHARHAASKTIPATRRKLWAKTWL